jgi:hypothetical protein
MTITPEWISAVASSMMVITTAFGFRYVYKQIQATTVDHLYSRMHDIHKVLLDKPDLWRLLCSSEPPPIAELSTEARIMVEMVADFFQQVYLELDHLPRNASLGWQRYMKDVFQRSPALHNFVVSKSDWYDRDFVSNLLNHKK